MNISYDRGILIEDGSRSLYLDPRRKREHSIVSHGHTDHLISGAHMTPQTLDIMKIRKPGTAFPLELNKPTEVNGFDVELVPAGHVFGSAMARVGDILYTGDFNPEGGFTTGKAQAMDCDTLIIESTYGMPDLNLPPKEAVALDLLAWLEHEATERPVAIGAYSFGKAQEVISLCNTLGVPVFVTPEIAKISEVYNKWGVGLEYSDITQDDERDYPYVLVTPPKYLKDWKGSPVEEVKTKDGATAFVSGWVVRYSYIRRYNLDAQFPLSDHADFDDLLWFTEQCSPKKVYTCHGYTKSLAKYIEKRLGISAEPIDKDSKN